MKIKLLEQELCVTLYLLSVYVLALNLIFFPRFIKKKWQKFLEAMMVAFITVNFGVFSIYAMSNVCLPVNYRPDNAVQVILQFYFVLFFRKVS